MVTDFATIIVPTKRSVRVVEELRKHPGIKEAVAVYGQTDVITRVEHILLMGLTGWSATIAGLPSKKTGTSDEGRGSFGVSDAILPIPTFTQRAERSGAARPPRFPGYIHSPA